MGFQLCKMINKLNILLFLILSLRICAQKIPIIIDTDTANEIDDLFALSGAISEQNFNIIGITSSQFNTSPLATSNTALESKKITDEILELAKMTSIPSILGSSLPIDNILSVKNSQASKFIIQNAKLYSNDNPLHIVILGSCTNIATAIINAPEILNNIKVYYLGFWHNPNTNSYNKNEFNTRNDPLAINFLLNSSELDLSIMTATTSQYLIFERNELDVFLSNNNSLGEYLKKRWDSYNRWWTNLDKEKKKWIMWDVAIIEAIANKNYSQIEIFETPPENIKRKIKIYTNIDVLEIKKRFWNKMQTFNNIVE